jgi:hypothetical protein
MGETFSIHLDKVTDAVIEAIPNATYIAMEHLRTSASTNPTPDGADVYYPGPYARYQHYEFLNHERGGERLYLSSSVLSETPKVLEILTQELSKVIE